MREYNAHEVEEKWRTRWAEAGAYRTDLSSSKPPWYFLLMFPYPSGPLHCGHWWMYGPPDAKARYLRMKGYNVLFPMGFDAFGLPAENAAIKRGVHPKEWTKNNIAQMRDSFSMMGSSYDPDRWVVTCEPEYYRWTQWLFLQMFKNDLAYRSFAAVDWCPSCNTTLAREQVIGEARLCDRCDTPVTKRELNQWFFRITKYAEELLDFSQIDWPERVTQMQTHWIGKSTGADIKFRSEAGDDLVVFTTRPDTVFGTTFLALAPEHPLIETLTSETERAKVEEYIEEANRKTEIDRLAANREKTGVYIGAQAVNPVNGEKIPIYVGDYVVMSYGSGAVMGVPAHDTRDFAFAKKYDLPIRIVVQPPDGTAELEDAYVDEGELVNSGDFDGLPNEKGKAAITEWLATNESGGPVERYRLRDWLISRQRYWGCPIPIVYCKTCGTVPLPDEELPVDLPDDVEFAPTGESPLKSHEGFLRTKCPTCGGPAERETDTMDTFMDSSWYWYRYLSPQEDAGFFDREQEPQWLPVTEYGGGIEHATMHLLYARFFAKALRDMGHVRDGEPFKRLFNQGLVLGADGEKMSKSRGNVVDPNEVVSAHGTDVFRGFLMFLGPWGRGGAWNDEGISGIPRFYARVWKLIIEPAPQGTAAPTGDAAATGSAELQRQLHQTIRRVGDAIEQFTFNVGLASLMELVNHLIDAKKKGFGATKEWPEILLDLTRLLAPFAPHLAEELWEEQGQTESVHGETWPVFDPELAAHEVFTLVVQVNGKTRDRFEVSVETSQDEAKALAIQSEAVQRMLDGKPPRKVIYVPGKLVNIVA